MGKNRGKPRGMNYADVLAQKRAVALGIEKVATDTVLQVEADTRTQRAMWLMVCSMSDAFGIGPKRMGKFFRALQVNTDELERATAEVDTDYAYEKLRHRAQQVSGMQIEYLYEHEAIAAGLHKKKGLLLDDNEKTGR